MVRSGLYRVCDIPIPEAIVKDIYLSWDCLLERLITLHSVLLGRPGDAICRVLGEFPVPDALPRTTANDLIPRCA